MGADNEDLVCAILPVTPFKSDDDVLPTELGRLARREGQFRFEVLYLHRSIRHIVHDFLEFRHDARSRI